MFDVCPRNEMFDPKTCWNALIEKWSKKSINFLNGPWLYTRLWLPRVILNYLDGYSIVMVCPCRSSEAVKLKEFIKKIAHHVTLPGTSWGEHTNVLHGNLALLFFLQPGVQCSIK